MRKKIYNKSKFGFFNKNDHYEDEHYYYNHEIRFCVKFPFFKKEIVEYKFVNDHWVEQ